MQSSKDDFLDSRQEIQVVTDGMIFYLSSLLETAVFDEQVKEDYYRRMSESMPMQEFQKMESEIRAGQIDHITHGKNYSATDLKEHLSKIAKNVPRKTK